MTRLMLFVTFLLPFAVLATAASAMAGDQPAAPASSPAGQCKILVLTGNEHPSHNWKETAPLLAKILAADPRLSATVNSDPGFLASPRLHDYDVLMLNYMNWESPGPGKDAQQNLKKFVEEGKGLVLVHFACGAFQDWPEFKNIAGRVWDPKLRPHDAYGRFRVEIADPEHPIVKGMKPFETVDELYTCLAGDKEIQVLAKATSKADKKDYPMAFVNRYGKGHVFHCMLGHDVRALAADGVRELYRRGTAWVGGLPPATPSLYAFCVEEGVPGVKPRPIAEQAKLFRELGFDGAAYPLWLDGQLSGNLQILDQAGLQFFMAFIRVNLKNAAQPFDPRVAAAMSQLKGRNTTVCVLLGGLKPGDPQGMEPAVKILRELGDQAARYDLRISIYHHMGDWTEGLP